ncbi:MAG: hypothetical protein ACYTGV_16370 [Planctomycetota bacterium]|jgi:hypothetical protein
MTEYSDPTPEEAPKRNLWAEFTRNPPAEKMLAVAAIAVLLGFLFSRQSWGGLFEEWFLTLAVLGSAAVIVLVGLDLFGMTVMSPKLRVRVLLIAAVLPALGFVIDKLMDPWYALMIAGAVFMAYAAAKITMREKIIKR